MSERATTSDRPFIPGRELCGAFYWEAVRPIIDTSFPGLPHSASLLTTGSEVLGFDTERSTDHAWGLRLQIVLDGPDPGLDLALAKRLPPVFRGWPTSWGPPNPNEPLVRRPELNGSLPHMVWIQRPETLFVRLLGFDPRDGIAVEDWLATPTQFLRTVAKGPVYHDGLSVLLPIQRMMSWYPDQVWIHLLACGWRRISQDEHLMGRAAEVGDELGSRMLAARLANDVVRLCFLIQRRYAPYGKWLGSAFAQLDASSEVTPFLLTATAATTYPERERGLTAAYEALARRFNAIGIVPPLDPTVRSFHGRPFLVLDAGRFADACREQVRDPVLRARQWVGSVDQVTDCTDILQSVEASRKLMGIPLRDPCEQTAQAT